MKKEGSSQNLDNNVLNTTNMKIYKGKNQSINTKKIFFKNISDKTNNLSTSNSDNDSKRQINPIKMNLNLVKRKSLALKSNKVFENVLMRKSINIEIFKDKKLIRDYSTKTDNEMNFLDYKGALLYDKRNFCEYYISLIRTHQLLIFIINQKNDYNSRIIKICFFFFMAALTLVFNVLFIDEAIIHHIYINKGKFDIFFIVTKIIYATIISYFFKIILTPAISTEKIILFTKRTRNKKLLGKLGIKFIVFFCSTTIILFLFWIYLISFFGLYKKIQILALEISGLSFVAILILPFIISIIPPIFRIYSLKIGKDRNYLYKLSQMLQYL